MHIRHIKRAQAIAATNILPSALVGVVNEYLISVSLVDKMADLVMMQKNGYLRFEWASYDYEITWTDPTGSTDPHTYNYSIHIKNTHMRTDPSAHISIDKLLTVFGTMSAPMGSVDRLDQYTPGNYTFGDYGYNSFAGALIGILARI